MNGSLAGPQALACVQGDIDMVRALGLVGIPCAVVASAGSPQFRSRFVRSGLVWEDFWEGGERLVAALLGFAAKQPAPPVLFYQEDSHLLFVSRHREQLAQAFRFVIADAELVEDLVDKDRFRALAARLGLPVPASLRLRPGEGGVVPTDLGLRYPFVVKPLTRGNAWWAVAEAAKALCIRTPEEFRELWPRLAQAGLDLLLQEMIPGPESRIESYHVYVDAQGEIASEFTGRKIRTLPLSFGQSTAVTITDAADVAALGRELVRRIGLRGVAKLDFKRAPDGTLYLLEVNPRFNLWHHPGAVAGVNLPALVYADLLGLPRPQPRRVRAGVSWCRFAHDRLAARASGLPMRRWLPWALRCEAKSVLAWDDPLPYLGGKLARWLGPRAAPRPAVPQHGAGSA